MAILGSGLIARLRGKGKTPEYEAPMSSLKAATRWAENLPLGDVFKSQQAVAQELKRFNDGERTLVAEQLAALSLLDEKSRELQETLIRQYLRNPRMARDVESQLWHAVYALEWELVQAYRSFVLGFSRSAGRCGYEKEVPRAALRAVLHYGTLMKWRMVRYLQPSERLWQRLHALYAAAEAEGLHQKPLFAYADDKQPRSIENAYGNILMLDLANSGTYYPRQIDLIDHWLAHWNHNYAFHNAPLDDQSGFVVDLVADHGPRRARNPSGERSQRYWSGEPLLRLARNAREMIREGASPSSLGLTEEARTGECQNLLEHLLHQWANESSREQRRAPRLETKRMVEIVHGLSDVLELVEGVTDTEGHIGNVYDEAADIQVYGFVTRRTRNRVRDGLGHNAKVERWVMQNESACGLGATVEAQNQDWLRVGVLVAVRPREDAAWRVGVVRRLARSGSESFSVGIEIIGDTAHTIVLADGAASGYTVAGEGHRSVARQHEALLLNQCNGNKSLVFDPIVYQPEHVWRTQLPSGPQRLRLAQPIQLGEGWMEVAFQAL